jgi:hypothetical protein
MSVWIKASEQMPPLGEEVLILFKHKTDELKQENLYYAIAHRWIHKWFSNSEGVETWSTFTEYQGYYEVVYWARIYDKPTIEENKEVDDVRKSD